MRQDNQVIVGTFAEVVKGSESLFVTDYTGLSVSEMEDLRKKLDEQESEHRVLKNKLVKIIIKEAGIDLSSSIEGVLKGNSSFTFGGNDVVSVAKTLVDYSKENEKFVVKGGILNGKFLSSKEVKSLASLPSRQELIAKVVGTIAGPLSGLVNVLNGNIRNLVGVVSAIRDKKDSE